MSADTNALEAAKRAELAWVQQHWDYLQYVFKNKKYDRALLIALNENLPPPQDNALVQQEILADSIAQYYLTLEEERRLKQEHTTTEDYQTVARDAVVRYAAEGLLRKRLEAVANSTLETPELTSFSSQAELKAYLGRCQQAVRQAKITKVLLAAGISSAVFSILFGIAVAGSIALGTSPFALIALPIVLLAAAIALAISSGITHHKTKQTITLAEKTEEALVDHAIAAIQQKISQKDHHQTPTAATSATTATAALTAATSSTTTGVISVDHLAVEAPPAAALETPSLRRVQSEPDLTAKSHMPRSSSSPSLRFHKKGEHNADTASGAASPTDQQKPGA